MAGASLAGTCAGIAGYIDQGRSTIALSTDFIQVTTAINSQDGAGKIADTLVRGRLAACVHVIGPITSTYWWHGAMQTAQEWLCVARTRRDLYGDVEKAIRESHPYELPGIVATPIVAASDSYLHWLEHETRQSD